MSTATLPEQDLLSIAEPDPDEGLVTQAEYARMKGVSKVYIGRLVSKGVITLFRGKINPDIADDQLNDNTSTQRGGGGTKKTTTFMEAKTKEKRYQAELAQLTYQQRAGELVKAKEVEAAAFERGRVLRDKLLNIASRIDKRLAAETDVTICNKIITDEIELAIEGIRNMNGNKTQ